MILYVMRHGAAEDHAPTGLDADRALTPRGREIVRRMAEALRELRGASPLRILSSPRLRARQTAAIVAEQLSPSGTHTAVELCDELGGEREIPTELVGDLARGASDVLLVGHNPSVQELIFTLARGEMAGFSGFSTATIVALAAGRESASGVGFRVTAVLEPRKLAL